MDLKPYIRSIADFPKTGIMFRDITPMLKSADAMKEVIRRMAEPFRDSGVTSVLAAEARGFVFGAPLAMELGCAFVPVRKPGKLPGKRSSFSMIWNTAPTRWRFTAMPSRPGIRCCWSTIFWQPAERLKPV